MGRLHDDNEICFFGQTNFRNQQRRFGIRLDDRRRHIYVVGKTGMGKTTLIENMIIQDIKNGHGLAFLDPHGDSAEKVLEFVPPERINDVIYFNPADLAFPIAFNIIECNDKNQRHMVASGLVGVFKKLWADSWGPRLEYLLRNAILALLDNEGTTLLGVMRILVDKAYRKKIVANVDDPVVRSFWVDEFSSYTEKFAQEAIAPIQNKVGQFLSNYLIRNIVGQVKSSFSVREMMDEGKILIMNLSKGRIGEDTAQLLGSMMITQIQIAAMTRVNIPESERQDFFLYVDEFQNFATEAFANILSEARKYRLDLVMAHQFMDQLSDEVKAAVFGNVGTMITFRVGSTDAKVLEAEFMPRFTAEDLVNLTKWEIYLKLMINGVASDPFSSNTLPPLFEPEKENVSEKIIKVSRERYGNDRAEVEEKIMRWSVGDTAGGVDDDEPAPSPKTVEVEFKGQKVTAEISDPASPERTIPWICDNCGKITYLSFTPKKPGVYCKRCLRDITAGKITPPPLTQSNVNKKSAPPSSSQPPKKPETASVKPADKSRDNPRVVPTPAPAAPSVSPQIQLPKPAPSQPKPNSEKPKVAAPAPAKTPLSGGSSDGTSVSLEGLF
ncbi:type IV secretion system DNA-binding domain-containing protein [Candidatus Falkowbacteria bacterium]|nr:type IV secretion system DNA-binding domain-containing protein [Candidatus Falkowbacteria bacterium]